MIEEARGGRPGRLCETFHNESNRARLEDNRPMVLIFGKDT
jgi:hypothetical protein